MYVHMLVCEKWQSTEAEQKQEILDWIEAVIGEKISKTEPFEKVLKDGVYLAKYVLNGPHCALQFIRRPLLSQTFRT